MGTTAEDIFFIIMLFFPFILLFGTIAALAIAASLRRKTGRWKGWPLAVLVLWGTFLFGDVPIKLGMFGYYCLFRTSAWVDPELDVSYTNRHTDGAGCWDDCVGFLRDNPDQRDWQLVTRPARGAFAEQKGVFDYYRAPWGDPNCVADWYEALARIDDSAKLVITPSGECLARQALSETPAYDKFEVRYVASERSPFPVAAVWEYADTELWNETTGKMVAKFQTFETYASYWIPIPLNCPLGNRVFNARDVMEGRYP